MYRTLNKNSLLFFDNRVHENMVAQHDDIERRTQTLVENQPLRLVFSGRLIKIKGADHLIDVARALRRKKIAFKMYICGDGELATMLHNSIKQYRLYDCVSMMGVLPFETDLLPFLRTHADLFVCCHRQGDPSCTYLETMLCGVPIVGYANQALVGIVERFNIGWVVKMDRPEEVANKIAEISRDRQQLRLISKRIVPMVREHTFENTFRARIAHAQTISESFRSSTGPLLAREEELQRQVLT